MLSQPFRIKQNKVAVKENAKADCRFNPIKLSGGAAGTIDGRSLKLKPTRNWGLRLTSISSQRVRFLQTTVRWWA